MNSHHSTVTRPAIARLSMARSSSHKPAVVVPPTPSESPQDRVSKVNEGTFKSKSRVVAMSLSADYRCPDDRQHLSAPSPSCRACQEHTLCRKNPSYREHHGRIQGRHPDIQVMNSHVDKFCYAESCYRDVIRRHFRKGTTGHSQA